MTKEPYLSTGEKLMLDHTETALRDSFAIAALPSVIVAMSAMTKHQVDELADKLKVGQADALVAKLSYYYADAMLAERKKEP